MKQLPRYTMVLWTEEIHDPVSIILKVAEFLKIYGEDFCPLLIEDNQKIKLEQRFLEKFISEHRSPLDNVLHILLKAPNGLHFNLTMNNPKDLDLPEVLAIRFDPHPLKRTELLFTFEQLYQLFIFNIELFQPLWGDIADSEQTKTKDHQKIRLAIDNKKIPTTIHWFNYFDTEMVERLGGREKVLAAPVYLVESLGQGDGVVLILQQEPFDYHNQQHQQHQQLVEDYFQLRELHRFYPKPRKAWWKTEPQSKE